MDIIDQYKKELEREGKSENTIIAYLSDIDKFAKWLKDTYNEDFYPENITSHDIQDYKNYLISVKNLKPATVNRRLVALSKFLDWCISQEMISDNPASRVKGIKEVNTAPKALERIDIKRLVREVYKDNNIRNIAIIELLVNTGIRVGELVSLNLNDVSISPRKGLITVRQGKGESYREVPLNKNVRKAITDYLDQRPKSKSKKLFLGQRGPIKETGVWRIVKKYAEMADIEATPHMLRHTFATRLLRKHGVDIVTVSRLLGHQSINSTAIYTQPSQKDMENAVDKLTKD